MEGLDDRNCQKIFPKYFDREFSCPIYYDENSLAGFTSPGQNVSEIEFDEQDLRDNLPDDLNVVVAIIRRYQDWILQTFIQRIGMIFRQYCGYGIFAFFFQSCHDPSDPTKYKIRYIGKNTVESYEPWSSTKIFAGNVIHA